MDSVLELYCEVDDFWQEFRPWWYKHLLESGQKQRLRSSQVKESEIMTVLILFHQSYYRHFKGFYLEYASVHLKSEFPWFVSYSRFVRLIPQVGFPLFVYLKRYGLGRCTGISFVDSTPLKVCHNRHIERHRVFGGFAERGKTL